MRLTGEQLEYAISQYVDGTLSELDRRVLEEQLAADAEARLIVTDYTRLNEVLRQADPLPAIDFGLFARTISTAIEDESIPAPRSWALRSVVMRYAAVAAAVAIAVTAGLHFVPHPNAPATIATNVPSVVHVQGPQIEVAAAPASIQLTIGPSAALAQRGDTLSIGDEAILTPSPHVVISAVDAPAGGDFRLY